MSPLREVLTLGGREVAFETGEVARQASGSVLVSCADSLLLAVVTADNKPTALDYMPLTTEWRNKYAAVGRIPGSYERRESKPTELETLTSRLIDRTIRPSFPSGWCHDTQAILHPLSHDPSVDAPVLAITAAAAALTVSDIPWEGPVAGVRVARIEGRLVAFPTPAELLRGDLDLVVSVSRAGIVMVEGGGREVEEGVVLEAFDLAREAGAPLLELLDRLGRAAGRKKRPVPAPRGDEALRARVEAAATPGLTQALEERDKHARHDALEAAGEAALLALGLGTEGADAAARGLAKRYLGELKKSLIRRGVLAGRRLGGRGPADVREISGRAGWLKRAHGSALFTRGETQAVVTCTLGRERDAQNLETLEGEKKERFLLHYNFPPYSVGETRPLRGPGRREIGHGHLARRALAPLIPAPEQFPYTVRLESTITESNGSSSMASICGGCLALMDAGVPLARPVAGIAMGLVQEAERFVVISDILGDEDHVGDMDFKVGGTEKGVTAIQLDNKLGAVPPEVMRQALGQARQGRLHILGEMAKVLPWPRAELSPFAPRVATLKIARNRIGDLIGPGGKSIRGIQEETGAEVEVDDAGRVRIYAASPRALEQARARVEEQTGVPVLGGEYSGRVVAVKPFGSFVRLFAGVEGLLAGITELAEGALVPVRVSGVNGEGKLVLERVREGR